MSNPDQATSSSLLRKLLIEPEYRIARHLLLIFILIITALNQSFMTLRAGIDVLGHWIFLQVFLIFSTYFVICYFNLWVLLPRYLLKKNYVQYALYLSATTLLLVIFQTIEERTVLSHIGMLDEFYTAPRIFITIISSFALILLCVSGGAMTVLLKHWMIENRKVNRLEKLHIQSEVEQLKEQVSPHLLFNILNRTGTLARLQPEKASDMLLRLSQLLRYQLYDCNRDRVLLSAEITFLRNYLTLEKMYSDAFQYSISSDKGCSHVLVSPMLFISFVQAAILRIQESGKETSLNIHFETVGETSTCFSCRCESDNLFLHMDFSKVGRRLDLLYKGHYVLATTAQEVKLTLNTAV